MAAIQKKSSCSFQRVVSGLSACCRSFAWPVILKISGAQFRANCTIPTNFPTRNSRRRTRNIGSARICTDAICFRAFFSARKFHCSSASSARCVSLIIGVLWGAIAGYVGGRTDGVLMRIVDVLYSLPSIIFVIVLITTLGEIIKQSHFVKNSPALESGLRVMLLFVGLGAVSWLTMARIVRGQVLSLRTRAFVEASRALGAKPHWILCAPHHPEHFRRRHHLSRADDAGDHSLRIVFEFSRPRRATADGQLGNADFRRRFANQSDSHLLVADCFSRRRAGVDVARAEFSRRRPARCVGCEKQIR